MEAKMYTSNRLSIQTTKYQICYYRAHLSIPMDLHNTEFQSVYMQAANSANLFWKHSNHQVYKYRQIRKYWHFSNLYGEFLFYEGPSGPSICEQWPSTINPKEKECLSFFEILYFFVNLHHLNISQ